MSAELAELDWLEGHSAETVARLEAALAALAGREPDAHVAAVAGQLGRFLLLSGEFERATPYVEQALALGEALDLPEVVSHALNTKAGLSLNAGRPNEARILLEGALALALAHNLHAAALRAYNNLAWALETQDRLSEGLAVCDEAAEHARRIGDRPVEVSFLTASMYSQYVVGQWDEALARAEELVDAAVVFQSQVSMVDVVYIPIARGDVGSARAWWGRLTAGIEPEDPQAIATSRTVEAVLLRAEGATREALAVAQAVFDGRDRSAIATVHSKLAAEEVLEAALALGERAKAKDVLTVLDGLRPGELTPLYRGLRARFSARLSEGEEAWAHFREAAQAYDALGAPFHRAVTQLEHAESLELIGPSAEGEALRAAARAVFERLGAKPWLERADRSPAGERPASVPA